ncbi:MAG TPA: 23S rRNA (adenine(2503)-C(2))-methyltransferase RlmN, partial [Gemmataceae bacterium]|nr:23S rRNA (adenine(2503)-C(2))-methyltransferase RlmN [Gemmataceae bacterium]
MNLPTTPATGPLPALLDQPPETLRAWFADRGQPALRVKQVRRWILAGRADSFDQMSDLPR